MKTTFFLIACSFALSLGAQENPNMQPSKEQNQYQQPNPSPQNTNVNPGQNQTMNQNKNMNQGMQGDKSKGQYCAMQKGGKLKVVSGEKEITSDVTLTNGTKIKTDGTIIKADGSRIMLKEGQCISMKGSITKNPKMNDKEMDRDKMDNDDNYKDRNKMNKEKENPMNK